MNAVQCDRCGKFEANPQAFRMAGSVPPSLLTDWVYAQVGNDVERAIVAGEFCGLLCAGLYITAKAAPAAEPTTAGG